MIMLDLDIFYLKDLKIRLGYRDNRSLKAWLQKYRVDVFGGNGNKRQYVHRVQFERACLQEKIQNLKQKYGNDWTRVFALEMKQYAEFRALLGNREEQRVASTNKKPDTLHGPEATKFLNDLHNL